MLEGTLTILGIGVICGSVLAIASKVFYVYVDPLIEEVESCLAGANCGGCGYTGCWAAASAVVAGKAPPTICIAGGSECAQKVAFILGVEVGTAEFPLSENGCDGGVRAADRYWYSGVMSCRAQCLLYGGSKVCEVGCLGLGDCVRACLFDALSIGADGYAVVDENKCVGCGACESICPRGIIRVRTPSQRLLHFNSFNDPLAPCRQVCPAEIDIPGYITRIRQGDYAKAVNIIRERNPLLLACGRVCPHPCEESCRRGIEDDPVSINQLKRFVADYEMVRGERYPVSTAPETGKRIAVVGGGPAGLSCAYFLRRLGHEVTIFEAMPKLGGMLRYGIPEYRLPKAVLDWEIQGILDLGIEVRTGVKFGKDVDLSSLEGEAYNAVFLGIGAWKDALLRVEGENLEGCFTGIDFLSRLASGEKLPVGRVAVVIGGGNTAIDCVRNLIRLGVETVNLVYRRTRAEMPANEVEIDAAEAEGVKFTFLAAPVSVKADEKRRATHLEYLKMELGEPDASGRRRPVPIEGSETLMEAETVITAIGQSPDISFLEGAGGELENLKTTRWNTFEVDPLTLQSNIPNVFAAGDSATGPALVVTAIGGGRRAARSIHFYVMGEEVKPEPLELNGKMIPGTVFDQVEGVIRRPRAPMPELEVDERISSFVEVDQVLSEESALEESRRCLHCCRLCYDPDRPLDAREAG
ncbi:MAG: FAD-dependent oxidoreductase [Thermodesulfobacteriota bacterium]